MSKLYVIFIAFILLGCSSNQIDSNCQNSRVISRKQVTPEDFNKAAEVIILHMLSSQNFSNYYRQAYQETNAALPIVILDNMTNLTNRNLDMLSLTDIVIKTLSDSGKVQMASAIADDIVIEQNHDELVPSPTLSLAMVIHEQKVTQNRTIELVYSFSLTLTDNRTGATIWKGNQEIGQQEKASIF